MIDPIRPFGSEGARVPVLAAVLALALAAGPAALTAAAQVPAPGGDADPGEAFTRSHDSVEAPQAAAGYLAQVLADAQAPTVIAFDEGPDATEMLPGTDPPTKDLFYANLAGEVVRVDLHWTPAGPVPVDREVVADGFNQPLGIAFADDGSMFVSDSYDHDAADRSVGVVYEVDRSTGERTAVVDGVPNGQHNINHIRFGPDDRLYLPVGNPNDSGNGTGTGDTDIFPYTGAFLSVDVDEVSADPAVLHWTDANGDRIADDDLVDHDRNQDFAGKVDVLAFGFRNIFGITWAPEGTGFAGTPFTGTNGADTPNSQDTLERIEPGAHHGFPFCVSQGDPGDTEGLEKTLWEGSPHTDFDCSRSPSAQALLGYHVCATGLDFPSQPEANHPDFSFPDDRRSSVYVGECAFFQDSWLDENLEHPSAHNTAHQVTEVSLDETGSATDVRPFVKGLALPTDVQFGPDGAMYIADAGTILRVAPTPASGPVGELLVDPLEDAPNVPIAAVGQSFGPPITLVPAGTTLEWTSGPLPHTVTSSEHLCTPGDDEACQHNGEAGDAFDETLTGAADTYARTFDEVGVYPYYCKFHYGIGMTGMVVVLDPADPGAVGPQEIADAIKQVPSSGAHADHAHAHAPAPAS